MVDYATLPIPDDTPPEEYKWPQRRSEIYNLIEEAGHPRNLERTQEQLATRYGVAQPQISDDIQAIREYEAETVGDDVRATTGFVCEKSVRELLSAGEYKAAADLQMAYFSWLQEAGEEPKVPDRQEVTGEGGGPIQVEFHETTVETGWRDDE
jgi:DNA-binding transcriptional regulator YdaS (Cro superfamily)